jgi:serine/threonine protein kinase/nitrous oxidase accessory protein NosD
MPGEAVQQLLELAQRSGLLAAAGTQDLIAQLVADKELTADEAAALMVEKEFLTSYQAEQLIAGHPEDCVVAGRYRIKEKLGEGGMGTVYKAQDTKLDRLVAIKVLPPHMVNDPGAVARFQREARALAKVSHSAIVQAHDTGEDRGRQFLVMEFVEGTNLSEVVKERGSIPPTLAAEYIHQAARGLQHAHDKGLVHRDLKPSNLLLTLERQIKILDLGLARFLQDQLGEAGLTLEGFGLGTPDYMAPEQFSDARRADARADIYSLGCTLYQLLSGQVPFPGSSLTEKARAHERTEPPPIAERCPEAPAGLVFVVQRMMAKRPADRFQTAGEVAEALTPYLAASSRSLPQIQATTSWHGSQLTLKAPQRRLQVARWAGGIAGAAVLVALSLYAGSWLPRLAGTNTKSGPGAPASPKVVTIPNGLTVAKDGTVQFTTINNALKAARPKMTIRVLDDATYSESFRADDPAKHEGVALETPKHAVIELPVANDSLAIRDVPGFRLKGFRIRQGQRMANDQDGRLLVVSGHAPGVVLQGLDIETKGLDDAIHLAVRNLAGEEPLVARGNTIRARRDGIDVLGATEVCLQSNSIVGGLQGIRLEGLVADVQLSGNLIRGCSQAAVHFNNLDPRSKRILLQNNTLYNNAVLIRIWDDDPFEDYGPGGQVTLRNNLLFESTLSDIQLVRSSMGNYQPADGKHLSTLWDFQCNWRDLSGRNTGINTPLAAGDHKLERVAFVSLDPSSPDFLRPLPDSPLATEGAGKEDPSLPTYVGAVPPKGMEPWDWDKTWKIVTIPNGLTVAKDGTGQYTTISEALTAVRPRMTIRVLDDATYAEALSIDDRTKYEGVTLEGLKHAVIELPSTTEVLAIRDVPRFRLKGFRIREHTPRERWFDGLIALSGHTPGVVLDGLDIDSQGLGSLIKLSVRNLVGEEPLVVHESILRGGGAGVHVLRSAGVCLRNNLITDSHQGIRIQFELYNVHISGNSVVKCRGPCVQVDNLMPASNGVLLANNTLHGGDVLIRIWDDEPFEDYGPGGQVELRNNLLFGADFADVLFIRNGRPADGKHFGTLLDLACNWRDLEGTQPRHAAPLAARDYKLEKVEFVSRDSSSSDFLRLLPDSPLATEGAGKEDPSLPTYVGAVPPKGVEPWDWDKTWKARERKVEPIGSEPGNDRAKPPGDKGKP